MDSFNPLLERTRLPQPSLQTLAVISIFEKLRSPTTLTGPESDPGIHAVTQCLNSNSPAVVDQSVRELCLLVKDSKLKLSRGLMELQSALEGSDSRFVNVFVKAIGFLVQLGFRNDHLCFRFQSSEAHPFVKILSCRREVQSELVRQVLMFIIQNKHLGMEGVCEFLRPFLNFLVIQMPSSATMSSIARNLLSSIASLCCSFPQDAIPVFKLLMGCCKYVHCDNAEDVTNVSYLMETIVDAFVVVLSHLAANGVLIHDSQLCGAELLEMVFSLYTDIHKYSGGEEYIFDMSRRLITVQPELGLKFIPESSSVMLSLFVSLIQSDLEHLQLSILKLVLDLIKWKSGNDTIVDAQEEILFVFPAINLMSSPSRYVKEAASELLIILKKLSVNFLVSPINEVLMEDKFPRVSRLEDIISRVFRHLWFQDHTSSCGSFYLHWVSDLDKDVEEKQYPLKSWTTSITEYCQNLVEIQKSSLPRSHSQQILPCEIPPLLGAIASVLILHPTLGNSAIDLLAVTGNTDPKLGVPLFLVILFYHNIFSGKSEEMDFHDILLKLLKMLPSLVSHPAMIPLVVQTILPMLQKDANPVLYATALRLLCKTWEINDRIFGSLQGLLLPEALTQFKHEKGICISMAVTVRDVCKKNPDRGVDIILSVEACIESKDAIIQSLGIQSLALLCEADVIDFYTAWSVVAKYVPSYSNDPVVANSICLLLRWGAMDAEAYPENAMSVLQILWEIATSRNPSNGSLWTKARESAIEALTQYEVHHIQQFIPDFWEKNIEMLVSEIDPKVLKAMERFEAKIITHEHITRRRVVKEKRVPANKIEKLLDVFPRAIGISGTNTKTGQLPGAAMFHLSFSTKDENTQKGSKVLHDLHSRYENGLMEIAESLQLSRNIIVAILSLQSWKPFLQRWLQACVMLLTVKASSNVLDTTSKAADDIFKCMRQMAEKSIPRSAENIGLAMGALCLVIPPSAHATKASASKFLLSWLFQHEHESRQWSAAISLGVISSCLHVTDHKQKFQNINALLEVACTSKSTLVRGACGAALGYSCQDLLTNFQTEINDSSLDKELQETDLLGKIVTTLCQLISQHARSSTTSLQIISKYFHSNTTNPNIITSNFSHKTSDDYIEEDIWGVSGLVIGLGSSIPAIYRSGCIDAVKNIKDLITSWIVLDTMSENSDLVLSMGACLSLPFVVSFSQKVELIDGNEVEYLASGYRELINELISTKKSGAFRQSLLMAACVGCGNFLGCVLNEGVHSLDAECVKGLLDMFKKIYSNRQPPLMHLGAMLGVVNALGAGAGALFLNCPLPFSRSNSQQKESCRVTGPLFSNTVMEVHLTSLIQDIFLVGQSSDDGQLQQYACWAVSFLRHYIWSSDLHNEEKAKPNSASQSFPEDSVVLKLSLWLMNLNYSQTTTNTVTIVLQCLTHAPRLPQLEWGPIIRRCMRYEDQNSNISQKHSLLQKEKLREQCLLFSLVHGSTFNPLLTFLDELFDFSRFKTLEMNLQLCILSHLPHTLKVFSESRLKKLLDDVTKFVKSPISCDQSYNSEQKSLLRKSFWKGIRMCFEEGLVDSEKVMVDFESCMEVLFSLLPEGSRLKSSEKEREEWSEAVKCLGKARGDWLLKCLQISETSLSVENIQFFEAKKKMIAKARLVEIGSMPLVELSKLKPYIFNTRSEGIWEVMVEVVMALQQAEGSVKRQWLLDAAEISCVTAYPFTAMQFMGLLCGSVSKYMPLLTVTPHTVLSDLPLTLTSLLLDDSNWGVVAEPLVLLMWTLTNRILDSVTNAKDDMDHVFLLKIMHHTCVALKHHLPVENRLMLANMTVP